MSELDLVINKFIEMNNKYFINDVPDSDKENLLNALRETEKNKIIEEIKNEYRDELIKEAKKKALEQVNKEKIIELKKFAIESLIYAFFIGLAVNQVTDLIGIIKGTILVDSIWPTVVITFILIIICVGIYFVSFANALLKLINNEKKK